MDTTLEFVVDGAPDIKRLAGSPGIEGGEKIVNNQDTTLIGTAKWEVSHWQVRWEDDDENYLRENRARKCQIQVSDDSTFSLSPSAQIRHEEFGCTVFIGGYVYALNKAGENLLQKIQRFSIEEVIRQQTEHAPRVVFDFVGRLCSTGILLP